MAITVKHNKVSLIPDSGDNNLVEPSDWNADHVLTGTIPISNGGTGASTANDGFNALAPTQTGNSGKYLTTDGSNTSWATNPLGTVTSVAATGGTGISVTGSPITTSGTLNIVNTAPDQTVVLNAGTGISTSGTYPNFTITNTSPSSGGTVTSVGTGTGLTGGPITTTGTVSFSNANVGTWAATPTSANLAAAVTDETGSGSLVFANSPTLSSPLIDNANPYISFGDGTTVTTAAGRLWYNGTTGSWNAGMGGGNITQQIGEELFVYGKASAAITDSPLQIVYHTGVVGASGVITFAPTIAGITDENAILGVATENIALNGFGRITTFGVVHGINTTGSAFGETWANDDVIWYNPVTGNPTKVKPVAPNIKFKIGLVINAGAGGSGSFQVLLQSGTQLGGTDSNVQITSATNGNILTYDGGNNYWKNTDLTAGTGISVTKSANGVLTVTNTSPSSGGTVTSVALTAPSIFTVTGSPITSSGTLALTYSGTALPILNGGTGQTTANAAFNALAPSQTSNSGKYLTTNGTDTSWATLGNAYSRTSFTATASQTTFTVSYTVGLVQVYVNGVLLNGADYTATNGTSVVLAVGCNAGEIVEVLAFSSFSVASTVSSFSGGTTGLTPNTATTGNVTLSGTLAVANGGTGVTTSTGSGNLVLSTSPTLVTPILGTPTSATLTNATGLPLTTGVTGTLSVANGGTGVTTSTGSGSVVLGTSPTIATPTITSLYGQNSNLVTTPYRDAGLVPGELIYRLNTAYVGTATTSAQSFLGVGVTISGSTVYQFEGLFAVSKTATASSHNFQLGFGGTATINNIAYEYYQPASSITSFNDTTNGAVYTGFIQVATATTIAGPSAATVYKTVFMKGTVSVNAGGTFIPQYTTSVSVGPYTTAIGSYFKLSPMSASGANTSIGTWA